MRIPRKSPSQHRFRSRATIEALCVKSNAAQCSFRHRLVADGCLFGGRVLNAVGFAASHERDNDTMPNYRTCREGNITVLHAIESICGQFIIRESMEFCFVYLRRLRGQWTARRWEEWPPCTRLHKVQLCCWLSIAHHRKQSLDHNHLQLTVCPTNNSFNWIRIKIKTCKRRPSNLFANRPVKLETAICQNKQSRSHVLANVIDDNRARNRSAHDAVCRLIWQIQSRMACWWVAPCVLSCRQPCVCHFCVSSHFDSSLISSKNRSPQQKKKLGLHNKFDGDFEM